MIKYLSLPFILLSLIKCPHSDEHLKSYDVNKREFSLKSKDGTTIYGVSEKPYRSNNVVVIMVSGTGVFDRDLRFGNSGTERDAIFRVLSKRFLEENVSTVRFDRRGVRYVNGANPILFPKDLASSTVETQAADLSEVYNWTIAEYSKTRSCVVFLGHSEGFRTIAELAASGAQAPKLIVGISPPMRSPKAIMHWQMAERGVHFLKMMDLNRDGIISKSEIKLSWKDTPASALPNFGEHIPNFDLHSNDILRISKIQERFYLRQKLLAEQMNKDTPFPNEISPQYNSNWWKSWFNDDTPISKKASLWKSKYHLFYGERDSQIDVSKEMEHAKLYLDNLEVKLVKNIGHSLGSDSLLGPISDDSISEIINSVNSVKCP